MILGVLFYEAIPLRLLHHSLLLQLRMKIESRSQGVIWALQIKDIQAIKCGVMSLV